MKLRLEYWEKVKHSDKKNLVFLDETGVSCGAFKLEIRDRLEARPTRVVLVFDTQFKCRTAYYACLNRTHASNEEREPMRLNLFTEEKKSQ